MNYYNSVTKDHKCNSKEKLNIKILKIVRLTVKILMYTLETVMAPPVLEHVSINMQQTPKPDAQFPAVDPP